MENRPYVEIFTDGSCLGNPGPGGRAAILRYKGIDKKICGNAKHTTNNQMELTAVIKALSALKRPCRVKLTTDSQYITNSINLGWLANWVAHNDLDGRPNAECWKELLQLLDRHTVEFVWVRGHNGMPENEECDSMATSQAYLAANSKSPA